ncbi:MAG: hypothetical protein IKI31_03845 [Treponema sp.]|nr:hypothetical protein [Treponema sp.]
MSIYISFGLDARSLDSPSVNEENVYQNLFKKCIRFLYSTKDFSMFFSFTANQLQFLKKKHPEFIDLCQELISRNQIEILGGGAYNPIFPLLFPVDRKGQIDELSTQIHKLFGKRPRGMSLYESCWDPSILPSIKSCGIDYLLLDSSLFSKKSLSYIPSGMTVLDKSLDILPLYEHCAPKTTIVPEVYLETLFQNVKNTSSEYHKYIQDRFIHINILQNEITSLLEANYFEKLISIAKETYNDEIQFVLPSLYRKKTQIRVPVHINHGIRKEIAEWITDVKEKKQSFTIYDFLQAHTQSRMLYNKMLYVASLVNQFHGDRARKNDAREKLWKAQSAKALLCNENGFFEDSYYRQYIYKSLAEAETIIRNTPQFTESISYFDYDGDGISDYIFRMTGYTAFVSCIGGSIRELSVSNGGSNYADNLGRRAQYDGYFDDYYRGLFVDHVFSPSLIKIYLKNKNVKSGIFPNLKYDEKSFSAKNKEVTLFARAVIPETNQILRIQKKYTDSMPCMQNT